MLWNNCIYVYVCMYVYIYKVRKSVLIAIGNFPNYKSV